MRPLLLHLIVGLLPALAAPRATAEIQVYPTPGDLAPSAEYRVEVEQEGRWSEVFVYVSAAQWKTNVSQDTAWAPFAFSGRVTVRVTQRDVWRHHRHHAAQHQRRWPAGEAERD